VDRCSDVFKHANMAGTTAWGGVIAVAGDDHVAKSSTAAHQSDHIFKACGLPVFFPANVQEILDLGVHAFAMSRFSGVWAGMKTIQEIVESSATAMIDPQRVQIKIPTDFQMPPGGVHIRWPDAALEQEARLFDYKWYAALAYIRANRLNYNVVEGPNDRFGIIASGKAYNDTRQALIDLGLDDPSCRQLGIRLHKVGVVWPLEAQLTREFATGLQEILVVEEKRQVIEYQLKEELYNWRADVRPNIYGKFNEVDGDFSGGEWSMPNPAANTLLRANADLSPALIAKAIAHRVRKLGLDSDMTGNWLFWKPRSARCRFLKSRRTASPGSAPVVRTTPAPRYPRVRVPWPASAAISWPCGWTAARPASPRWAAKVCLGSVSSLSPPTSIFLRIWATALTFTAARWRCASRWPLASTSPTRFFTTMRLP
jgi:TPP-dependent indolepyruvate ferredoxin oxidoreductase alpha subunit